MAARSSDFLTIGRQTPCDQKCERRTPTCKFDGTCDEYRKFNVKMEKIREERYKESVIANYEAERTVRCRKTRTKMNGFGRKKKDD